MSLQDFLNASFNELVRRYGAVKRDNIYEVPIQNAPWVLSKSLTASLKAGRSYKLHGLNVSWSGPGEVYVVLTDWEIAFGYILAKRRRMFSCVRRPFSAPYGVTLPPHIKVRELELVLSDSETITCVDKSIEIKAVAVIPTTVYVLDTLKADFGELRLEELPA
ncbi:hypothetical protein [Thermoproteus tenax]|uniref:Uncharacterized protein n=1 Tax=Thermoproteus tenax (strain ATCC 35583 / DSM 2078 / JCM 9277 / NBRC 100435 / Kra 1) TaxID=768679 RepID=G4RM14_THETK|nr:hypothetical protein [Thermoproteus tenax]CCC82609.1 hypothetical protein TTX_1995 [Thermoproteus tenax Kra 1]